MSSKLLYTLKDENPNLHKQIGCINSFFLIFDRHQFLRGRHVNKKTPPIPVGQSGNHGAEPSSALQKASLQRRSAKKVANEKQRASTETSSSSSSFSPSSNGQTKLSENPSREFPMYQPKASLQSKSHPINLPDVARYSATKKEAQNHIFKHVDSPRPLQLHKPAKQRNSVCQAPCNSKEEKDGSRLLRTRDAPRARDGSRLLTRDVPRFSLDGRVSRDTLKPSKIKELPRLSLDSRQSTMRATTHEMKPRKDLYVHKRNSNISPTPQQELGSYKQQSSVVAKLMGLEAFPGDISSENQTGLITSSPQKEVQSVTRSARTQSSHKESISPRKRNADSVTKSYPSSKIPTEPAPWRRGSQVPSLKANSKASSLSASVYGEIEKGLADAEFKKSGKDLRALKRILEAMQKTAEMSENIKHNQGTKLASRTSSNGSLDQSFTLPNQWNLQSSSSAIIKGSSPRSGDRKFQISTGNRKGSAHNKSSEDPAQSCNPCSLYSADIRAQTSRPMQTLKVPIHITRENTTSSGKSSGTMSPRLQKKNGPEKQSCMGTKSRDSNMTRRQLNRQVTESGSPGTKQRPNPPNSQQRNNQLRDVKKHGNAICIQSESSTCLASHIKTEATSTNSSDRSNRTFFQHCGQKQKNLEFKLKANRDVPEPAGVILEQPSPISVLNTTFYRDESPSPVKKVTNIFEDDEARNSDEAEWSSMDLNQLWVGTSNLRSESDQNKSDNIRHLVSHMGQDESINYIAVLPEDSNPEHRYIYKIVLASGLLRDLDFSMAAIPFRPWSSPITPKVFLAVEESIASISLSDDEQHLSRNISHEKSVQKIQRKLIFDAVNETLGHKLVPEGCSKQWFSPSNIAGRRLKGQQLLRELCLEIDQLQANKSSCRSDDEDDSSTRILWGDLVPQSTEWSDYPIEISGLVVDIDSLIFRDLINEVVNGETASLQTCSGGYRRQLFY